jgi:serine/threonine protein kinase
MSQTQTVDEISLESLLAQLSDEFIARLKGGESPDVEEYVARYPQHAGVIRNVLKSLQFMQVAGSDSLGMVASEAKIQPEGALGDYRIVREIGRGGMGVVYEAVQISLGRPVALKVLPFAAALDARQLQRFRNEAHAAGQLHHTSIVPVYGVGCERGVHYYAMQYIEGQTLAAVIRELRSYEGLEPEANKESPQPLSRIAEELVTDSFAPSYYPPVDPLRVQPPQGAGITPAHLDPEHRGQKTEGGSDRDQTTSPLAALSTDQSTKSPAFFRSVANLGIQAAEALEHAHQLGIIHRDIKPANLIIDYSPLTAHHSLRLWITDFGLAQVRSESKLTITGDLLGTLRYMSPEQALARRAVVDHHTDIYSLAATLYELLTLQPVFAGEDRQELLRQITLEEPRRLRSVSKAIPAELETIVLKALEKNPADRYATAQDMADDLRRFLEDKPIRARRPTLWLRVSKWSRRHRALVSIAAASLVAVTLISLSSALVTLRAYQAEARQRHEAEEQRARAMQAEDQAKADAAKARQEEENAKRSDAEARAVLRFFLDKIMAAARPKDVKGGLGTDATIRAALDKAEPEIRGTFAKQPLVEASIREALGHSYWWLGESELAIPQYARAVELRRQVLGPTHSDTLTSMDNLGNAYNTAGRFPELLRLGQETLKARQASLGPDHVDTIRSLQNLGCDYYELGRLDEAIPLLEVGTRGLTAKLGPDDPDALIELGNLVRAYLAAGRSAEALSIAQDVFNRFNSKDPNDPWTLIAATRVVMASRDTGSAAKVVPWAERLMAQSKAAWGTDHQFTLGIKRELGSLYLCIGRLPDAIVLLEEVVRRSTAKRGADHFETMRAVRYLIEAHQEAGNLEKAEAFARQLVAARRRRMGSDNPETAAALTQLARVLLKRGQLAEAGSVSREAVAIYDRCQPNGWQKFHAMNLQGATLLGQQSYTEAERLLVTGYQGMKERDSRIPVPEQPRLHEALEHVVRLYEAWGKKEQAEAWRAKQPAPPRLSNPAQKVSHP